MASHPHGTEARHHDELRDMLRLRLEELRRKQSSDGPIKTQCPSPLRATLSSTPSFETYSADYPSSQEIKTSLQLLVEQQPGSDYFAMAAKKILLHSLSRQILCHSMESIAVWSDDLRRSLRTAGADEVQQQVVMQHLRDLATTKLTTFFLELYRDDVQPTSSCATVNAEGSNYSRGSATASPKRREWTMSPVKAADSHANKRRKLNPVAGDRRSSGSYACKLRVLDLETFMSSDRDQRKVLARQVCSLPIELYFHHLRLALPKDTMDYEQASLIWTKLKMSQTEQWKALLECFRNGDIAAATAAGADLLVEHDILEKLEHPGKPPGTLKGTGDGSKGPEPVRDSENQRLTRSQAAKAPQNSVKSRYF